MLDIPAFLGIDVDGFALVFGEVGFLSTKPNPSSTWPTFSSRHIHNGIAIFILFL